MNIVTKYKTEFLLILEKIKPLIEQLFNLLAEKSLSTDDFSMKNEAPEYLSKLEFYQNRIESLENRRDLITEKLYGQYDVIKLERGECWKPKGQKYLNNLSKEIEYDIEAYIDTFYSAIEHILTLLSQVQVFLFIRITCAIQNGHGKQKLTACVEAQYLRIL